MAFLDDRLVPAQLSTWFRHPRCRWYWKPLRAPYGPHVPRYVFKIEILGDDDATHGDARSEPKDFVEATLRLLGPRLTLTCVGQ